MTFHVDEGKQETLSPLLYEELFAFRVKVLLPLKGRKADVPSTAMEGQSFIISAFNSYVPVPTNNRYHLTRNWRARDSQKVLGA